VKGRRDKVEVEEVEEAEGGGGSVGRVVEVDMRMRIDSEVVRRALADMTKAGQGEVSESELLGQIVSEKFCE
jgi:hypothetical protein